MAFAVAAALVIGVNFHGLRGRLEDSWAQLAARVLGAELMGTEDVIRQRSRKDCGPAALCNLLVRLCVRCVPDEIAGLIRLGPAGASLLQLRNAARKLGLGLEGWQLDPKQFEVPDRPYLARLRYRHFVVVLALTPDQRIEILDPAIGHLRLPFRRFQELWTGQCLVRIPAVGPAHAARNDLGRQVEYPVTPDRMAPCCQTSSEGR